MAVFEFADNFVSKITFKHNSYAYLQTLVLFIYFFFISGKHNWNNKFH